MLLNLLQIQCKGIVDYFNEDAKNLRRAFLKAPVKI